MCSEHGLPSTEVLVMDKADRLAYLHHFVNKAKQEGKVRMKTPCNGHDLTWTEEEEEAFNNMDSLPDVEIEYQQRLEDDECPDGACKI